MVETDYGREILENIRHACELYARENNMDTNLGGMCGIASYCIRSRFSIQRPTLAFGYFDKIRHCWIETNGFLVDITATQFKGVKEKVIVTPVGEIKSYKKTREMKSYYDFRYWWFPPTRENVTKILTLAATFEN